jgi:hypothetical protein
MDIPFYRQRDQPWLYSSFREFKDHDGARSSPSYGNCRISRTESPSAENIDAPARMAQAGLSSGLPPSPPPRKTAIAVRQAAPQIPSP